MVRHQLSNRDRRLVTALVIAGRCVAMLVVIDLAHGQAVRAPGSARSGHTAMTKIYMRPLLRTGRLQYCLKEQGLYEGRLNGRMTPGTLRALRRLRDDLQLKAEDVAQDWALHAVLWRQCRSAWSAAGGTLDRFGVAVAAPPLAEPIAVLRPPAEPQRKPTVPAPLVAAAESAWPAQPGTIVPDVQAACLPQDLREILARTGGPRPAIAHCDLPCLSLPADLDRDDAAAYERRLGFTWCKTCVPYGGQLGLDDIARIERVGGLTLCPDARRLIRWKSEGAGVLVGEALRGTRALFRRDVRPSEAHNAVAVVVGVAGYGNGLPRRAIAERDAAGVLALLTERLGFRGSRVIGLNDPTRAELDGVFGRSGNPKGLLADRLKDAAGSPVFVYFSGLGAISGEDGEAYLLPADAAFRRERSTGFAIETLYQNLTRIGAGPVTVVLEVDFANSPSSPIISPNAPETRVSVLPRLAVRGLTVFTASERDQRTLDDAETGLSLFTRHLISGLSGHADSPPIGNGDGIVDSSEAFVYAAQRTAFAARKLSGVLQRPMISQGKPLPIGRVGGLSR